MKQTCSDLEEIWRDIVGYEGLYEDSNLGRVKSLKYGKERILTPAKNNKGYLYVDLCKDGKVKKHLVHRLVAESFIPNPLNLPIINHKDENPLNNRVENLEWCDRRYNVEYSLAKPVLQYTVDGKLVREWPSTKEAERLGGFNQSTISACCLGKRKKHGGFIWTYKKEIA